MGEIHRGDRISPEVRAELLDEIVCRSSIFFIRVLPFRVKVGLGHSFKAPQFNARQHKESVRSHHHLRDSLYGSGISDLSLSGTQESFLISEVRFDIPSPEIGLQ